MQLKHSSSFCRSLTDEYKCFIRKSLGLFVWPRLNVIELYGRYLQMFVIC